MIIGVLGVQGNLEDHIVSTVSAMHKQGIDGRVVLVRDREDLRKSDALIITGGESTTMWKLLRKAQLFNELKAYRRPIFGTCAGMILLAKGGMADSQKTGQEFLGKLDAIVNRNAFGRQRESFSVDLDVNNISSFHAVFIRAPAIESVGKGVEVLAEYGGKIVAARQGDILVTAFHPELTDDSRVHELFLRMV